MFDGDGSWIAGDIEPGKFALPHLDVVGLVIDCVVDLEQCGFYVALEEFIPFSSTGIRQGWVYIFSRVL